MSALTFDIAVSRMATGKDGYNKNRWTFGNSFHTERHDLDSLIKTLADEGYSVTMVHNRQHWYKRKPEADTAGPASGLRPRRGRLVHDPARDCAGASSGITKTTYRVTQNFISQQVLSLDDDRAAPGVFAEWLSDPFFSEYGAFIYPSASSQPEAQKGRPVFILDRPLTDPAEVKEALKAFIFRYGLAKDGGRLDNIHDAARVWYGAPNSRVFRLGNILPYDILETEILTPYREALAEVEAQREAQRAAAVASAKLEPVKSADGLERYVEKSLTGIFNKVSAGRDGQRHGLVVWAGRVVGGLEAAPWVNPVWLASAESRLLDACRVNGYTGIYSDSEILRNFKDGKARPIEATPPAARNVVSIAPATAAPEIEAVPLAVVNRFDWLAKEPIVKTISPKMGDLRRPAYAAGVDFGFEVTEESYHAIVKERLTYDRPLDWQAYVEENLPELDPLAEYHRAVNDSKRRKMELCGTPFEKIGITGEVITYHFQCGYCERCKRLDAANLKRSILEYLGPEDAPLTLLVETDPAGRRKLARELRTDGIAYDARTVKTQSGVRFEFLAAVYWPDRGEIIDELSLTPARLLRWVIPVEGYRSSCKLFGSVKALRARYKRREDFEIDAPVWCWEHKKPLRLVDGQWVCPPKKCTCKEECKCPPPCTCAIDSALVDAVRLTTTMILTEHTEIEAPRLGYEVTPDNLQEALTDLGARYERELRNSPGSVILAVCQKTLYTPKTSLPELIDRFNANQTQKAPPEVQKSEPQATFLNQLGDIMTKSKT